MSGNLEDLSLDLRKFRRDEFELPMASPKPAFGREVEFPGTVAVNEFDAPGPFAVTLPAHY